jgi:diacylglycerol kinase family enzyme
VSEANGAFVKRFRVPWAEWEACVEMPINLDGEPVRARKMRFQVLPGALRVVLPDDCPMTRPAR